MTGDVVSAAGAGGVDALEIAEFEAAPNWSVACEDVRGDDEETVKETASYEKGGKSPPVKSSRQ